MNTYLYNAKHTLPDKFKEFSPSNGWGTYEGLCEFVQWCLVCSLFLNVTIGKSTNPPVAFETVDAIAPAINPLSCIEAANGLLYSA
jgi:hypothetical protein